MTTIRAGDGWNYTLSEEDFLWLGRAADGEGGSPAAVLWTWFQRYSLPDFRDYPSLTALVRAHSQPVNPIWMRGGSKCSPGGSSFGTDACSEWKLDRREHFASLAPSAFDLDVKLALTALRAGVLPNPVPRAVDFADRSVSESFVSRNPGSFILRCIGGNCHIVTRVSARWPNGWVKIEGSEGRLWGLAMLVGLFGTAGYLFWRTIR